MCNHLVQSWARHKCGTRYKKRTNEVGCGGCELWDAVSLSRLSIGDRSALQSILWGYGRSRWRRQRMKFIRSLCSPQSQQIETAKGIHLDPRSSEISQTISNISNSASTLQPLWICKELEAKSMKNMMKYIGEMQLGLRKCQVLRSRTQRPFPLQVTGWGAPGAQEYGRLGHQSRTSGETSWNILKYIWFGWWFELGRLIWVGYVNHDEHPNIDCFDLFCRNHFWPLSAL